MQNRVVNQLVSFVIGTFNAAAVNVFGNLIVFKN
jgi:hypothetical protein